MSAQPDKEFSSHPFSGQNNAATKPNSIEIPSIPLPKGGGALKSIDEKFSVNAANGTCTFSVPFPLSPSRGGFQPSLSLSYNSGRGNNIFGLGWDIGMPSIKRKTDSKLPVYRDAEESDVFLFSGSEDLVPVLNNNGRIDKTTLGDFRIISYRPRSEGLFACIEKISAAGDNALSYWKVTTRENVVTFFGINEECRISDPQDDKKIFEWLPEISFDDKGNCIIFTYKQEDKENVPASLYEQYRLNGTAVFTNRYVKRIKYGNKIPFYPGYVTDPDNVNSMYAPTTAQAIPSDFMFELVFDYGEHIEYSSEETKEWTCRKDAFSHYKAGFEIRTYRLCERVMMFHQFDELNAGARTLVRSLGFRYDQPDDPEAPVEVTYLESIYQNGYILKPDGSYYSESLPPLKFEYQRLKWNKQVRQIAEDDLIHVPVGLSENYQWTDLYNEGISGILSEQAEGWYYKCNLGDSHFSTARLVSPKPSFSGLSEGSLQLMDIAADGRKQIVSYSPSTSGYFELTDDLEWESFRPFDNMPGIDFKDPNIRMVDLDGDGKADLLITEEYAFRWYPSKGVSGYGPPESAPKLYDEEKGPAVVFADGQQRIYMADMSGDGMADIVRISASGSVCYWPNLGYGHFGAKVNMGSIVITDPFSFNPDYLQLADVTGTGSADIIYTGNNKWQVWINRSGNSFSVPFEIDPFWQTAKPAKISVVDLLGNGTGCIVWSSPMPADRDMPMQYIDLMDGKKPHLMIRYTNGMGKINSVEYKSSVKYYLEDKKKGQPWITRLVFPVHCVSRVTIQDMVTDLQFTTSYSYHHGYYDHAEKEFRGFGRVDQVDTEEYEYLKNSGASNATDIKFHEPPALVRTWYHTGAFTRMKKILDQFETEYWYNDVSFAGSNIKEHILPEVEMPAALSVDEFRESNRCCKGIVLRTEVFALDKSAKEKIPYKVIMNNYNVRLLQAKIDNAHAVFMVQQSESVTLSYERSVTDPRISHSLNLEIDEFGNILKNILVNYGREDMAADHAIDQLDASLWKHRDFIKKAQVLEHIVYTENKVTEDAEEKIAGKKMHYYRLPFPWSVKTYECYGIQKGFHPESGIAKPNKYFEIGDFEPVLTGNNITYKGYHELPDLVSTAVQLRLIERVETLALSYDLETPLEAGMHGALGLSYESYQLAFTPQLVDKLYNSDLQGNMMIPKKVTDAEITKARYCHIDYDPGDVNWWIRSGSTQYINPGINEPRSLAGNRYYSPISYTDPFGSMTKVAYSPNNYFLFIEKTTDALNNSYGVIDFDYRVLSPGKIYDMNDNLSQVSFSALGPVIGMATMGKGSQADELVGFNEYLTDNEIASFFNDPLLNGRNLLGNATARMIYDFKSIPVKSAAIAREMHVLKEDGTPNPESRLRYSFEYTDGMGNSALKKIQTVKGLAKKFENGVVAEVEADPRWIGDGRVILNNKGKPVKKYEPYFSTTHLYEAEPALREYGVTPVLHYDSAGRMIRTDYPDGTLTRTEYDNWHQKIFDRNDTLDDTDCSWRLQRESADIDFINKLRIYNGDPDKEKEALAKSLIHKNTPSIALRDSLGRSFYTIDHNKWQFRNVADPQPAPEEIFSSTKMVMDIEGNVLEVIDERDNIVMEFEFDMLGHTTHQLSMDSGERRMLNDCMGKFALAWDSKDQKFEIEYDILHRPLYSKVIKNNLAAIYEKIEYGTDKLNNMNGVAVTHYDTAGIERFIKRDLDGNIIATSRVLCKETDEIPDWNNLSDELFLNTSRFDALGRIQEMTSPHTSNMIPSVHKAVYSESGLLRQVIIGLKGTADKNYVNNIDYNAKGQRTSISYGNNIFTKYEYDPETLRLRMLITSSDNGHFDNDEELKKTAYQYLSYTYDPVGNIINIEDEAQQTYYFSNALIKPENNYQYDALYRLIEAKGREHIGQNLPVNTYDSNRIFAANIPSSDNALRNYIQRYTYDSAGNMTGMAHVVKSTQNSTGWTRTFAYGNNDNRLLRSVVGTNSEQYTYDMHGNMEGLPHLPSMTWNFRDQLQHLQIQAVTDNDNADSASYLYDGSGQRMRKVVTKGNLSEERIYLNGFEIFRKWINNIITLERESLHIMDNKGNIAVIETLNIENSVRLTGVENLTRYQYSNHLGSACLELDDTARIISYEEFHPFGSTAYQNQNKNIKAAAKRFRYSGMERDEESGMEYHGARYYLPWLARWLTADPIGIGDGLNVYRYAMNKPTVFIDSNGKQKEAGPYNKVGGDHVRQVASQIPLGGNRKDAPHYYTGLAVPTADNPAYLDPNAQLTEKAINKAQWGRDYNGNPAEKVNDDGLVEYDGIVKIEATGKTEVGKTTVATPSPWFEDIKSLYKLYEAGQSPDEAYELVTESSKNLGDLLPVRVPDGSQSIPRELREETASFTEEKETKSDTSVSSDSSDDSFKDAASEFVLSAAVNKVVDEVVPEKYQEAAKALAPIAAKGVYELGKVAARVGVPGVITLLKTGAAETFATLTAAVEVGAAGTVAFTGLAITAAAGSVTWAVEDTRRALNGEKTMTDVASETYSKLGIGGTLEAFWWAVRN
jgi:RHS repeat-associated protein